MTSWDGAHDPLGLAGRIPNQGTPAVDDPDLAIRAHDAVIPRVRLAGADGGLPHRPCPLPVVGVDARQDRLPRRRAELGPQAEDAILLLRPAEPVGGEVELPAPDLGQPLRIGQLLLAARQRLLGLLALGDVDRQADRAHDDPVRVGQRLDVRQVGPRSPVILEDRGLAVQRSLDGHPPPRGSGLSVPSTTVSGSETVLDGSMSTAARPPPANVVTRSPASVVQSMTGMCSVNIRSRDP